MKRHLLDANILRFIITILTAVFFSGGCYNEPISQQNGEDGQADSTAYRLYATYYSNSESGVLVIDPLELTILDTIPLELATFISLSNDSQFLYVGEITDYDLYLPFSVTAQVLLFDLENFDVVKSWNVPETMLDISNDERYFFIFSILDTFWVYDKISDEIIYSNSYHIRAITSDPINSGAYVAFRYPDSSYGTNGIFHFNTETGEIDQFYEIGTIEEQRGIIPNDLVTTNRGDQLLFTYMTTDLFNDARLRVIDVETGDIITTKYIQGTAKLAVTKDDKYVYITDPGLWEVEIPPSGIIRRYDVNAQTVEDFIDMKEHDINPNFNNWPLAERLALFPGDTLLAISSDYPFADLDLMIWNLNNKTLLGTLNLDTPEGWVNIASMVIRKITITRKEKS